MIGLGQIFTLLFVTLGPLKVLAPFAQRTRGVDGATVRQIAWWTFAVATFGIVAGSFLGRSMLQNWGVSIPALMLTGGIVFFLVALRQLLEQYEHVHTAPPPEALPASPLAAATRLVFPMVLTPYGIVAVITLLTTSADTQRTVMILGLVLVVMVLDLLAMLLARRILVGFAVIILQVIGSVLAVLQVALSVEFMIAGLRSLGVIAE
jgi:multiple antibiotic resistance protein